VSSPFADEVLRGVAELRSLDHDLQRFGAKAHRYAFHMPLSEDAVAAFEARYNVALPADYRAFLREVGNGGAGPGYGVCKVGEADTGSGMVPWDPRQDPSLPFPHSRPWSGSGYLDEPQLADYDGDEETFRTHHQQWRDRDSGWWAAYLDGAGIYYGTVPLCHYGCGQTALLVVNGPSAGEVWNNLLSDGLGVTPALHGGQRLSFTGWYTNWLQAKLQELSR
jgi:SMI1 / KNR4 family (SUKH-1)